MHNSIESRMPYLSDHFYNFRNTINKNFLIKKGLAKYILRDAFKYYVPNSILFNSEKTGFFLPLKETINFKSKKFLNVIFKNDYLKKIIDLNLLKKNILKNKLSQQEQKFVFLLYNAAVFLKFYRK